MRKLNTALAAAVALSNIGMAHAQSGDFATIEEIIVTANRRQEMLQDVPMSISAFNESFFKDAGLTDFKSLESYAPSLKIVSGTGSRDTSIRIRGIGSSGTNAGIDPSVGVFIDGIYQGRAGMSLGDFMDIERVEVLRGPQGTLYGKNTAAGAISVISRAPVSDFEGSAEVIVGNYNNVETRGMVNVPLNEDGSAVRVSGYKVDRDGFDDNVYVDAPQDELNNVEKYGVKARALFETDKMGSFTLALDKSNDSSDCCAPDIITYDGSSNLNLSFEDLSTVGIPLPAADPFDRELYADREYHNDIDVDGVSLEWNKDLDSDFILTWLNAYRTYESSSSFDADFSSYDAGLGTTDEDLEQRSSEFRVTSPEGETIDYQMGVYYYYSEMDTVGTISMLPGAYQAAVNTGNLLAAYYDINGDGVPEDVSAFNPSFFDPVTGIAINTDINTHTTTNYAAFGQATWNVSETFTATLGLRYTYEKKERVGSQTSNPPPTLSAGPFGPDITTDESETGDNVSPTLTFRYYPTDDGRLMYYANIARGFKSGGFNQQRTSDPADNYFDDEISTNYEAGWKGTYLDSSVQFNGSIFFVDYEDFQSQAFDGTTIAVKNAGSLESYGMELDLQYVHSLEWSMGGSLGYTKAEYKEFEGAECTVAQARAENDEAIAGLSNLEILLANLVYPVGCKQDLEGQELDSSPELTVSSFTQYEEAVDFLAGNMWFARLEYIYTDSFFLAQDLDPNLENDATDMFNLRVGVKDVDGVWEALLWVRNLTDEESYLAGLDVPVHSGYAVFNAPPRTYGASLRYNF